MMTESKADQIKRLQGNDTGFYALSESDKKLLHLILRTKPGQIVFCSGCSGSVWTDREGTENLYDSLIYRIHRKYKPDTPVFEGYVLCEVLPAAPAGNITFRHFNGNAISLHKAITFGCCGYNYKEAPSNLIESNVAFVSPEGILVPTVTAVEIEYGYKPANLKYVVFLEK